MKRFKSCALYCSQNQNIKELVDAVCGFCKANDYPVEKKQTWKKDDTLLVTINRDDLPLSRLILSVREDENKIVILNIFPSPQSGLRSLDHTTYNIILDTFKNDVFMKISPDQIEENQEDYTIEEVIPLSYKKLQTWLNAFPLSGHILDEHRWFDFLISLREKKEHLSIDDFSKYIEEEYGWDDDVISKFASKFEEQMELLEYYDEHRQN